ncbi:putative S1-like domain-containing protein [Geopyxis carbonaria]|nr:putative S1-like domain-containing protein [Geopyxis carbonaria]
MPRSHPNSKRALTNLETLTTTPPPALEATQHIARISSLQGKSLFLVALANEKTLLVELAPMFRGKTWLRRGGFVLVDTAALGGREGNRLGGEIVNVVRDERQWRKMGYWPEEFREVVVEGESEGEEESRVGRMPPSGSESEGEA